MILENCGQLRRDAKSVSILFYWIQNIPARIPFASRLPIAQHFNKIEQVHPINTIFVKLGMVWVLRIVVVKGWFQAGKRSVIIFASEFQGFQFWSFFIELSNFRLWAIWSKLFAYVSSEIPACKKSSDIDISNSAVFFVFSDSMFKIKI